MTSIKIKFRPSTVEGKAGRLYFQFTHQRVTRTQKTSYCIYPDEWDSETNQIILPPSKPERHEILRQYKKKLKEDLFRINECAIHLNKKKHPYSIHEFTKLCKDRLDTKSLSFVMLSIIRQLKEQRRVRTSETYRCTFDSFMRFRDGEETCLDEINQETIKAYETYLKNKQLTLNTISFYMRILRAAYNHAVENGLTVQRHPFRHVYTGIERTNKRAVTSPVIKDIKNSRLPAGSTLDHARDMFLFSFYTRGMSFVDMAYLKKKDLHNGILTYRRKKTGQQLSIKWEKCMQNILDKYPINPTEYLLPIITSTQKDERKQYRNAMALINRKLKTISELVHSPYPLSMYVARHSWASIAKSKNIPLSIISEGMGHDSETTTQIYLASLDTSVIDKANHLIINDL